MTRPQMHNIGHHSIRCNPKHADKFRFDRAVSHSRHSKDSVNQCPSDHQGGDAVLGTLRITDTCGCQDRVVDPELVKPSGLSRDLFDLCLISPLIGLRITTVPPILSILGLALLSCFTGRRLGSFVRSTIPWFQVYVLRAFVDRCKEKDCPKLLDLTIALHRCAMKSYIGGQPVWVALQGNLAVGLLMRFQQRGDRNDLDEAIEHNQTALRSRPFGHPDRSSSLNDLANALCCRFEQQGNRKDLDKAIKHHQSALLLRPVGHPDRSSSLNNLAYSLCCRFEQQGDGNDLDEAIKHHQNALLLQPAGHPDRSSSLNNLANALRHRFEQEGDEKDLDEAIKQSQNALLLRRVGHPDRSSSLNNLANAVLCRFEQQGEGKDLDEAITHYRSALHLRPVGHPDRSSSLSNLASALCCRFEQQGDEKDLDEAIKHHQNALCLRLDGHPDRSTSLNNLANAMLCRYEQQGYGKDLGEAIKLLQSALLLRPVGHPDRASSLNNLAVAELSRFEQHGNGKDLDEAIKHHQSALLLRPIGHPDRYASLSNLTNALRYRFEKEGDGRVLDEAIKHSRSALLLQPVGHPDRSTSLNNLADTLLRQFDQQGDSGDLDEAITLYQSALLLRPVGHPSRPVSLNGLSNAKLCRFREHGDEKDLDEAIEHSRSALLFRPVGRPGGCVSLINLARALLQRFDRQPESNEDDLVEVFHHCQTAESCIPAIHPLQLIIHQTFSNAHLSRWYISLLEEEFHHAMQHCATATACEAAGALSRLQVSLQWVQAAEIYQPTWHSALEAYAWSLRLLDSHISAASSVSSRYDVMQQFPVDLAVDAASCALRFGDIPHALELLEQGRALLWTQMARFHTLLDDLRFSDPRAGLLVTRFQELSSLLKKQPDESSNLGALETIVEVETRRYKQLVDEWNDVIEEIRKFEGFSRFLLPPLFSDLAEAACEGPVIVLVASKFSCDGVIVLHRQPPIHVPLTITVEWLKALAVRHRYNVSQNRTRSEKESLIGFVMILRELWKEVVSPVITKLEEVTAKGSRIWWCPTSVFTAFPLHAAGEYRPGKSNLSQIYISSYTPTLMALVKARKKVSTGSSSPVSFAAIGQAQPDGQWAPLPFVERELDSVESFMSVPSATLTKLTSSLSTREAASRALQDNHWVHLSCHGQQYFEEPFKSCFAMRDGPLSLLDIIDFDLSHHEFAFLSACKTAMGDSTVPDEVIHLAAGLQFAGVKSVVGTLWQVQDEVAFKVVSKFYEEFCAGDRLDCTRAALALHRSVAFLQKEKVPLQERIVFIHIGM
jgi:CHAT domain-containing protein/tetratricopeptide (TPR) repeat protein